jgi:alkanesulfonate monooxygenase SsuD/methylene tetrahydromethanopterin reductase-like flavin-dependent oxidoreductase (luciferase family)
VPKLRLVYDLRRAPFSPASSTEIVATALDQCEWADQHGFFQVNFGEHHGSDDGYVPSPLTALAAVAARTKHVRLVPIILAPLYDPIRLAEETALVDLISGGRLDPVIGTGYVPSEFAMFGKDLDNRVAAQEECVEVLKRAWTGEPFPYGGTTVRVTPRPHQQPRPLITLAGMSRGAARRAARIADRFEAGEPGHWKHYEAECARLGRDPGPRPRGGPAFLYVTEDPDAAWPRLAPFLLHHVGEYARWTRESYGRVAGPFGDAHDLAALQANPAFQVITPDHCVELARRFDPDGSLAFTALMGGLPPEMSWTSLELFAKKVLPNLSITSPPEKDSRTLGSR